MPHFDSAVEASMGMGHLSAAAFLRPGLVPFVGEEMFQRRQQERTEPAAVRVHAGELIFFQQPREKFLGQILRVVRIMSLPPHKSVKSETSRRGRVVPRIARVRGFIAPAETTSDQCVVTKAGRGGGSL